MTRFRTTILSAAGLLLATAATHAQVTVRVQAENALTVRSGSTTSSLPAGTILTAGATLTTSTPTGGPGCLPASATARVTVAQSPPVAARVVFENRASPGGGPMCGRIQGVAGRHAIRIRLDAASPVDGRLVVVGRTDLSGLTSGGSYEVDIGADGTFELDSAAVPPGLTLRPRQELELPLTLDPTTGPLEILVRARAATSSSLLSLADTADVVVEFRTDRGRFEPIGGPCGPTLTGTFLHQSGMPPHLSTAQVDFEVTGSAATPHAFFVLGTTRQALVIPPQGCVLHTDLAVPVLVPTDPSGRARLSIPYDPLLGPADFFVQFLAATNAGGVPDWRTSNAYRVRL